MPQPSRDLMTDAAQYYGTMMRRGRFVEIVDPDGRLVGVVTFFLLTSDAEIPAYYHRPLWSTPYDNPIGTWVYVDKLWATEWNRAIRIAVERGIVVQYPYVEWATWYRPTRGADRRYTTQVKEGMVDVSDV